MKKIEEWEIVGNAHHDRKLFDLVHEVLMSEDFDMLDKIKALRKLDAAMGESGVVTAKDIENYIRVESGEVPV